MAKITFQDKVDFQTSPLDRINKSVADDWNQVKSSVNTLYDDVAVNTMDISTLQTLINEAINRSGYAEYADTQYTEASPFTVTSGTKVTLPNNAGSIFDEQKPTDITTFYDETVPAITGRNGDGLAVVIEFKVKPLSAASDVRVRGTIDIGGTVGEIYPYEQLLQKGANVEHFYRDAFAGYTRNTWEANGGIVKVEAVNSNIAIYDIRYVLTRTHKARPV